MKLIKPLFILVSVFMYLLPGSLKSQTQWSKYSGNPVINSDFDPGAIAMARPSVLFDGISYHMWYSSIRVFPIMENQLHLGCMGYATSNDGISWQPVNPVAMGPIFNDQAFDMLSASQGWVIEDRDTFKMWYRGINPVDQEGSPQTIGYAWSLDGSNWTRVSGPGIHGSVYDSQLAGLPADIGLAMPCVLKDGATYHMWHSHVLDEFFRIGYAISSDGIHWTKVAGTGENGAVIDRGTQGRFDQLWASWPAVIKTEDGFMMWYVGFDGSEARTGCSISADGVHWSPSPGVSASGACFEGTQGACVISMDSQYHMWYAPGDLIHINLAVSDFNTAVKRSYNSDHMNDFRLKQNYPNPVDASTIIEYVVNEPGPVDLVVFDGSGKIVGKPVNAFHQPGIYTVTLNLQENLSGIYFYKIQIGDFQAVKKMVKSVK
jgi:hypothetical protein